MPRVSAEDRALQLASRKGLVTSHELLRAGIHSQVLTRLVAKGALERPARGTYRIPGREVSEHHALALVSRAQPRSVICLLSALAFHDLGTQLPHEIWIALDRTVRPPAVGDLRVRSVTLSGDSLTSGVETHRIEGRPVRIFGVAKTVADCFKFRNKIGLDVALEALRDALRDRRATVDELWSYAKVNRVTTVMRPYLEALV